MQVIKKKKKRETNPPGQGNNRITGDGLSTPDSMFKFENEHSGIGGAR